MSNRTTGALGRGNKTWGEGVIGENNHGEQGRRSTTVYALSYFALVSPVPEVSEGFSVELCMGLTNESKS